MNPADILKYGQLTFAGAVDKLPESAQTTASVCGVWSVKDIIAHLASYEHVLEEVLNSFLIGGETPYLKQYTASRDFNDAQVAQRKDYSYAQVWDELTGVHARVSALVPQIPSETWRQPGTLPWYGEAYALDDFIVYAFYGHKREHSAQIAVFRDRLIKPA